MEQVIWQIKNIRNKQYSKDQYYAKRIKETSYIFQENKRSILYIENNSEKYI